MGKGGADWPPGPALGLPDDKLRLIRQATPRSGGLKRTRPTTEPMDCRPNAWQCVATPSPIGISAARENLKQAERSPRMHRIKRFHLGTAAAIGCAALVWMPAPGMAQAQTPAAVAIDN